MNENDWFVMRPQKAQAYGRPEADGFLIRYGGVTQTKTPRAIPGQFSRELIILL